MFKELPIEKRVGAARRAGFDAVEHPDPFQVPAATMARIVRDEGVTFSQLAAGAGNAAAGEKGLAAVPGREREFRESFLRSIDYAEAVAIPLVHPMAGVPPAGMDAGKVRDTYLANLTFAVETCRGRTPRTLIEAIGLATVPGYYLNRLTEAVAAADAVSPTEIQFLVDTFHAATSGDDAAAFVRTHGDRVGHVHIADYPGRHEPGTGNIDFRPFLEALAARQYRGAIGFEYVPKGATRSGLAWLPEWRSHAAAASN